VDACGGMQHFLVALDTSESSGFVLARAVQLASALGAKIRLLSVAQLPAMVDAADDMLREREREIPERLRDGIVLQTGIVSEVICAVARSYGADLVVVGAHRHGLLAATIVHQIDRPIIVFRPAATEATAAANIPRPSHRRRHDEHRLLEAATLAGAVVGAAVGAVAGPPGAVVGGVVGLAVGMLAGRVLDDEGEPEEPSHRGGPLAH
jgi:nucleotide-binding universal stress UspA family protein